MTLESLERRTLLAAMPLTTLAVPGEALLGESLVLQVGFSNDSLTDTGYGPYVDLLLPATGQDGAGSEVDDGVTFLSARYLGQSVPSTVLTFDAFGHAAHPLARDSSGSPVVVSGPPGDQCVVLQLPFGSYTPGQPVANVSVTVLVSPLADVGSPLPIQTRGGFRFGNDPLDNPASDPTLVESVWHSATVTPILYRLSKSYSGPEDETATGPNFPRQYTIAVDIANGATLTELDLTDVLPGNLQFVGIDSTRIHGVPTGTSAVATPDLSTPGGVLTRRFATVTGTTGANDASLTFTFFVPHTDADGDRVLDPQSGNDEVSENQSRSTAQWTPADPRDPTIAVTIDPPGPEYVLHVKSLAVQKSGTLAIDAGAPGLSPGDTLEYQLAFQISDFFTFADLRVTDVLSDGQRFDSTFAPTFVVTDRHGTVAGTFTQHGGTPDLMIDVSQIGNDTDPATDGRSQLVFDVSQALINNGAADGILQGGRATAPDAGPAVGTLIFRAVVQDEFSDSYLPNTPNVSEGDLLHNHVTIAGSILDNQGLATVLGTEQDTSEQSLQIATGTLVKAVYAVNGNTSLSTPVHAAPGDAVTYRFTYHLPLTDFDGLSFIDYLPLPVFDATSLTTFDPTVSAASPPPGTLKHGPADTFLARTGLLPSLTTSATSNSFTITYPDFDDPASQPSTLELLATFVVSADPFTDQLLLTNQIRVNQYTTNASDLVIDELVQFVLTEPLLRVTKGVVASDHGQAAFSPAITGPVAFSPPGSVHPRFSGTIHSTNLAAQPINSDVAGVDAADLVTFAIVLENTGTGLYGAFDVRVRDTLPSGFTIPAGGLNLSVTDGAGNALAYTDLGGGLFGSGLELVDAGSAGALAASHPTSGANLAVITYDLQATTAVTAGSVRSNTATLFHYAGLEGGPDHTLTDLTDSASTTIARPTAAKSSPTSQAVIGEVVTFQVVVAVPEGTTPALSIVDTLDSGLAFVDVVHIDTSNPTHVAWSTPVTPLVTNSGQTIRFELGDVLNTDQDNDTVETVTLTYRAVVLNVQGNQQGTNLDNSAVVNWTGGALPPVSAAQISVVEPNVTTTKSVTVGGSGSTGDAGDAVQYVVTLRNNSGVAAYDLTFSDTLPWRADAGSLIVAPSFSLVDTAGIVTPTDFELTGNDPGGWVLRTPPGTSFDMPSNAGRTITITIHGTLALGVRPAETISNTAQTRFTSIDGDPGTISPHNPHSTERTGLNGPGTELNNYATQGTVTLSIFNPTPTKSLVATSEGSTSGNAVVIGEILRYRLTSRLAESTAPSFQIIDQLPAGLRMLNDGTAMVAFVSNQAEISSSTLSGPGLAVVGDQTTLASITPTFGLPAGAITGGPFTSGTDPVFHLGTLVNSDNDADQEFVVLEFNALVENIAGNQAGVTRNNSANVRVNGAAAGSNSNTWGVSIVEPVVAVTAKTANPATGDAGDRVSYRVTYANASAANVTSAFDLRLFDTLPPNLLLDTDSVTMSVSGGTGVTDHSAANTVDVQLVSLAPGGSVQIDYQATLLGHVQPEQLIVNTANLTYTSLPGTGTVPNPTGSTVPGAAGTTIGERNGSGGVNDYSATATATVTVTAPEFSKIILSTNQSFTSGMDVAIGELVSYELMFSVVEGTTLGVTVFDQFPTGLALVTLDSLVASPSLTSSAPGGFMGALAAANVPAGGHAFTLDLQTITNSDSDNSTIEMIRITFSAVILNVESNQSGANLINSATVFYSSGDVTTTAPAVRVVEPNLHVSKIPSATHGDAGWDPIPFTITVSHSAGSTADAFDVLVQDIVPAGFDYVPGSLAFVSGVAPDSLEESLGVISATFSSFHSSATSSFAFAATLNATTAPGQTLTNVAEVRYTSLPGSATLPLSPYHNLSTERTGSPTDPGGLTNSYVDSAASLVTVRTNSVAGHVFSDTANNGSRDGGDTGIPDVTITLTGTDNLGHAVLRTAVTNLDGQFAFADLRPGSYQLAQTQPAGYLDGLDTVGTQGGTAGDDWMAFVLPPGVTTLGTENHFAELLPARVSGVVFDDRNNNGQQDTGEDGLAGVGLRLTGTDDHGSSVELSVTTDSLGVFHFELLRPGTYTLTESQPVGWFDGRDTAGSQGGVLSNDVIAGFSLDPGDAGTGNQFGEIAPASIAGTVYEDLNNHGARDSGEAGIADVVITLTGTDDLGDPVNRLASTTADGSFHFPDLRPGTYVLAETQPTSPFYFDGVETAGSLGGVVLDDRIEAIIVVPGASGVSYLFGELPPADPVGYVFVDVNNNGRRDPGEPPIPDVVITVTGIDDLGQSVTLVDTTDSQGFYQFQFLRAGIYRITQTQPPGYIDGQEENGLPPAIVGDDYFEGLTLTWGEFAGNYNFGELALGSLSGRAYLDANQNSQPDAWETGIPNVTMTLTGQDIVGNLLEPRTTLTNADGDYSFGDLPPGTYRIAQTQPAGYLDGADRVGSLGGVLQPDAVDQVFLGINNAGTDYDFGENGPLPQLITKQYFLARNRRL